MNMEEKNSQVIFDKNAVEFVTVAAEFCGFMECVSDMRCRDFVDKSLKLLPLLYLKASLLPACERMEDADPETFVTETDYEVLRGSIASLLGEYDDYLEVFLDDMAYSDTPMNLKDVRIYDTIEDRSDLCRCWRRRKYYIFGKCKYCCRSQSYNRKQRQVCCYSG